MQLFTNKLLVDSCSVPITQNHLFLLIKQKYSNTKRYSHLEYSSSYLNNNNLHYVVRRDCSSIYRQNEGGV